MLDPTVAGSHWWHFQSKFRVCAEVIFMFPFSLRTRFLGRVLQGLHSLLWASCSVNKHFHLKPHLGPHLQAISPHFPAHYRRRPGWGRGMGSGLQHLLAPCGQPADCPLPTATPLGQEPAHQREPLCQQEECGREHAGHRAAHGQCLSVEGCHRPGPQLRLLCASGGTHLHLPCAANLRGRAAYLPGYVPRQVLVLRGPCSPAPCLTGSACIPPGIGCLPPDTL